MVTQFERWRKGERMGAPLPPWVQELVRRVVGLCREVLAIDPAHSRAHAELGFALERGGRP